MHLSCGYCTIACGPTSNILKGRTVGTDRGDVGKLYGYIAKKYLLYLCIYLVGTVP